MFIQGSSPVRTRCMAGPYPPRQFSAKWLQSTSTPLAVQTSSPSRIIEPRQSTTVPKTSKVIALISEKSIVSPVSRFVGQALVRLHPLSVPFKN